MFSGTAQSNHISTQIESAIYSSILFQTNFLWKIWVGIETKEHCWKQTAFLQISKTCRSTMTSLIIILIIIDFKENDQFFKFKRHVSTELLLLLFVLISIFVYLLFNLLCNHSFN